MVRFTLPIKQCSAVVSNDKVPMVSPQNHIWLRICLKHSQISVSMAKELRLTTTLWHKQVLLCFYIWGKLKNSEVLIKIFKKLYTNFECLNFYVPYLRPVQGHVGSLWQSQEQNTTNMSLNLVLKPQTTFLFKFLPRDLNSEVTEIIPISQHQQMWNGERNSCCGQQS